MEIFIVLAVLLYFVTGFFTVRMVVLDSLGYYKTSIDPADWWFGFMFGFVMPFIGYIVVVCMTKADVRRRAHFMQPKDKVKRERRPWIREALGKVFLISEDV